ncbi:hypothetical protein [Guptibacillus hwajinpoensis]|uniref:hypothetical protein n=1 Tax=Guptibacillus hwajinpoensis TaxID=208199 RepID=UPI0024B39C53|nr:hypothetical protein [Pseudalkalibacillus hwajinpoensis]
MNDGKYTSFQKNSLEKNVNIKHVTKKYICYEPSFKLHAVHTYLKGKKPNQIFEDNDFDLNIIGFEQPERCLTRWKKTFIRFGEEGLLKERRGKFTRSKKDIVETSEEKLCDAEEVIRLLRVKNRYLREQLNLTLSN